jgi:hypothetical protein
MADIYVAIRNQNDVAMSSVNGEIVIVLLTYNPLLQIQQPVTLRTAMATFVDLPAGDYTIVAKHPDLLPTEARYDVRLAENAILGIRFTYNEPERRLLTIETEMRFLS